MHGTVTTQSSFNSGAATLRRRVFKALETAQDGDLTSRIVDIFLITLIAASVISVILESMPGIESRYGEALWLFEVVTVGIFSVEYVLRLWSSVELESNDGKTPLQLRIQYIFSFHAVIDIVAILPFYLLTFGIFGGVDMRFLRAVRLLRVLKLTRYSAAMNMVFITFQENGRALSAAFLILITVMLLAASGMYYFERQSQPEAFGSIPAAMWWAFATLTTVGYGDVTPITAGGRIFGALITVVGIGMVALPTSILATGYSQQLRIGEARYKERTDEALDDGVLSDDEVRDLETFRIDLGLNKHTASQILDAGLVDAALRQQQRVCPHCRQSLPPGHDGAG